MSDIIEEMCGPLRGCRAEATVWAEIRRLTAEKDQLLSENVKLLEKKLFGKKAEADALEQAQFESEVAKEREAIDDSESRLRERHIEQLEAALKEIAKYYTPNWNVGDTHESTQRLSQIARVALGSIVELNCTHPQRTNAGGYEQCDICGEKWPDSDVGGCMHGVSIHKKCEICRHDAEMNGAKADNSDRFFSVP